MLDRLLRLVRNFRQDVRFGLRFLGGTVPTRFAHLGAHDVANSDYRVLPLLFDGRVAPDDVLVDVGCGRGRVLNFWLSRGYRNPLIGIELDPTVADVTRRRLSAYENVRIISGSVLEQWPANGTVFYLFNPFSRPVVEAFSERAVLADRAITIVYYNPVHLDVFQNNPRFHVQPLALPAEFHAGAIVRPVVSRHAETSA